MEKEQLKHLIAVATGRERADLCVKNCHIVDVFNHEVFDGEVYITDGVIVAFGHKELPEANNILDARGRYLVPGFIDSHLHIESSHVSPPEYARLVVPCGTTTVIADPHIGMQEKDVFREVKVGDVPERVRALRSTQRYSVQVMGSFALRLRMTDFFGP